MEKTYPWGHHRPFNVAALANKAEYGGRVQKLSVNAGFTCPNRDGAKATGGCTYCNNQSFSPAYCHQNETITQQLLRGINFHEQRYRKAGSYFAYFQSFSNTYANIPILKERYNEALAVPNVIGLIIGTRPDCVDNEVIDLLKEYAQKVVVVVELGIESVYNSSLEKINRGHNFEDTLDAVQGLTKNGIETGGHYIFGLPGETKDMMMESAKILSAMPLKTIKFHQLQIIEGTEMANDFRKNTEEYKLFELDEYIRFISEYLCNLRPDLIIERLAGESPPEKNLGTHWGLRYDRVLQGIEKYMLDNVLWQGKYYNG